MKRRLSSLLTALSLLLFVATAALWVRSHWRTDVVGRLGVGSDDTHGWASCCGVCAGDGGVRVGRLTYELFDDPRPMFDAVGPPGWSFDSERTSTGPRDPAPRWSTLWPAHLEPAYQSEWDGFGFSWFAASLGPRYALRVNLWGFGLPLWLPTAAFSAPPALWAIRRMVRRLRRPRAGYCARCGYDLRATPGRCPECGQEAA